MNTNQRTSCLLYLGHLVGLILGPALFCAGIIFSELWLSPQAPTAVLQQLITQLRGDLQHQRGEVPNTQDDDLDNFIETIDNIKRRFNELQPKAGPKLAELSDALDELLTKLHSHPQYQQCITLRKKLLKFKQDLKQDLEAHSSEPNSGPLVPGEPKSGPLVPNIPPLAHHW